MYPRRLQSWQIGGVEAIPALGWPLRTMYWLTCQRPAQASPLWELAACNELRRCQVQANASGFEMYVCHLVSLDLREGKKRRTHYLLCHTGRRIRPEAG